MVIAQLLDAELKKEQEERKNRERSGKFSPSSFGQCFRRQIWKQRGVEESNPPDIVTLRVFRAGKVFHNMIQSLLPAHQNEVEITTDDVHGFADIVTDDEVIDIKSQNSWAFALMRKPDFVIADQKIDHVKQVVSYAMFLNKPRARLVYVNKDTLEIIEFVLYVEMHRKIVEEELAELKRWAGLKDDPPAEPRLYKNKDGGFKECQYCQFYNTCKGRVF